MVTGSSEGRKIRNRNKERSIQKKVKRRGLDVNPANIRYSGTIRKVKKKLCTRFHRNQNKKKKTDMLAKFGDKAERTIKNTVDTYK